MVNDCERKSEALREKARTEGLKGLREPNDMTFLEWVHRSFNDYTNLERRLQWKLQKEWDKLQRDYESSSEDSYHPIEDVGEDLPESNKEIDEELTDELEDYLVCNQESSFVNEEVELFKERKCQLLGIPYQKPPTITAEKFEVIKYSFGPMKEYAAIKITEFKELGRSKENVAELYKNIFRMKEEGWHVVRTK